MSDGSPLATDPDWVSLSRRSGSVSRRDQNPDNVPRRLSTTNEQRKSEGDPFRSGSEQPSHVRQERELAPIEMDRLRQRSGRRATRAPRRRRALKIPP